MRKIDSAWLSLIFSIPGVIFVVLVFLGMLGLTLIDLSNNVGTGLPALFFVGLLIILFLIVHFVSLIPAWLLLRKSQNKPLSFRIGTFFSLLTLIIIWILYYGGELDIYFFIGGTLILLLLWWFLIYKKFR